MALDGKTPAQAAGLKVRGWKALLDLATTKGKSGGQATLLSMKRLKILAIALLVLGSLSAVSSLYYNYLSQSALLGTRNPNCYVCLTRSEDHEDLAIGVPDEAVSASNSIIAGAVNVIYGSASGLSATSTPDQFWTQDSPNIEGTSGHLDDFGSSLAAGDFNNDAFDDLAIGVPAEDLGSFTSAGAVNVIYGSSSGLSGSALPDQLWQQDTGGIDDAAEAFDQYGRALASG